MPWWSLELGRLKHELKDAFTNWQRDKSDLTLKMRYTHTQRHFDREVKYAKRTLYLSNNRSLLKRSKSIPGNFGEIIDP